MVDVKEFDADGIKKQIEYFIDYAKRRCVAVNGFELIQRSGVRCCLKEAVK